ncbi:MAG: signal peptidase I [Clostridiales bacterium]|nr:signal peptidase I [Clostridiales bacterium]
MSQSNQSLKNESTSLKRIVLDLLEIIGAALALTFLLLIFIQPSIVEGSSMYPTLHDNDKLLLWKLGDLEKGDIVVFDSHDLENSKYVKRIIGTKGDHVVIAGNTVIVNNKIVEEPYINEDDFYGDVDLLVSEDSIFVLGDNRNHSNDSRAFGEVKLEDVEGKVVFNLDKVFRNLFS